MRQFFIVVASKCVLGLSFVFREKESIHSSTKNDVGHLSKPRISFSRDLHTPPLDCRYHATMLNCNLGLAECSSAWLPRYSLQIRKSRHSKTLGEESGTRGTNEKSNRKHDACKQLEFGNVYVYCM